MQKFWIPLVFSAVAVTVSAQSLTVASMDSVAYVNSHSGIQATAHIAVTNTSNASKDYQVIRRKVGTTGLVDSNYFCWDLCYPVWADQSQGTVTIGSGATANDFSGYTYVTTKGASGQDTIWYTFKNVADINDSLQVFIIYAFNPYVDIENLEQKTMKLYPSPIEAAARIYGLPIDATYVKWIDALGRVKMSEPISADGSVRVPDTRGIWMAQVQLPSGIQTLRISVY